MSFLKQKVAQFVIPIAIVVFFVIVLLTNFPVIAKLLPVVTLVLLVIALPLTLKRLPNEPREKVFLFYIGMGLVCCSRVLDTLFAVNVNIRLVIDIIGVVLLLGSFLIKSQKPTKISRN
jgi:hypothetical protein